MSTAPSGYQNPKTNWAAPDVPLPDDFNRIEGNQAATETGSRTLDQALASPANVGTLRQILSWFAGRLKAITGKTYWYEAPVKSLEQLNTDLGAASTALNEHTLDYVHKYARQFMLMGG